MRTIAPCLNCKSPQEPDARECEVCGYPTFRPLTEDEALRMGQMTIALRPTAKLVVRAQK